MIRQSRPGAGVRAIIDPPGPERLTPVLVAAVGLWVLRVLHQGVCNTGEAGLNTMLRLCYSDIPLVWRGGLGQGGLPYGGAPFDQPPVVAGWAWLAQRLTFWWAPIADGSGALGRETFFVQTTVLALGAAFLVMVVCLWWVGRRHPRGGWTGRIGLLAATSVGVLSAGTISWTLVPAALVVLALVLWADRRPVLAGVLLGSAASAAWYPWMVLVALAILCWRADRVRAWSRIALTTAAVWIAANLPIIMRAPDAWLAQARAALAPPIGLGSAWFVLQQATGATPRAWIASAVLVVMAAVAVAALSWLAPRRPRVAQVVLLLLLALTMTAPVYSPQHVLWLVPLVLLARPVGFDWALFSAVEALYWAAVWGHLLGNLWAEEPRALYAAAIFLRLAVQAWIASQVVRDIRQPWRDPVRRDHVDDPLGGVLDHAPDRGPVERLELAEVTR